MSKYYCTLYLRYLSREDVAAHKCFLPRRKGRRKKGGKSPGPCSHLLIL
jgi:hypothetical protein